MKIASVLVLVIGLSVAAGIYFFAPERDENMAMVELAMSKQYARTLQRLGGKQALLFDDIQRWVAARFEGKQLGVTIGALSILVAGIMAWIDRRKR